MHPGISYCLEHPTSRRVYEDVDKEGPIATISHSHGLQEGELEGIWDQLLCYLKDDKLPADCSDVSKCRKFLKCARGFIVHDERLWKVENKGQSPRLMITDQDR